MAEWSYTAIDKIQAPGGDIQMNGSATDSWFVDPTRSTGLGEVDIRGQDDEKGQTDGLLLHPRFLGGQRIGLHSIGHILSASTDPGYVTARDALIDSTLSRLKSMVNADGALHFIGGGSITVRTRAIGPPQSESQLGPTAKSMLIVLVSATPP